MRRRSPRPKRSPRRKGRQGRTPTPEPLRTCVGCRRTAPTSGLVRIARDPDGTLALGPGPGRGAWLCAPPEATRCLDEAVTRRSLDRALRTSVRGDEAVRIRAKLEAMSG